MQRAKKNSLSLTTDFLANDFIATTKGEEDPNV
jgi:hypothetical protein